jgi:hypothetical protein
MSDDSQPLPIDVELRSILDGTCKLESVSDAEVLRLARRWPESFAALVRALDQAADALPHIAASVERSRARLAALSERIGRAH